MKTRHLVAACLLSTTALLSACNDKNNPPSTSTPTPNLTKSISEFAKSLFALVSGNTCNTALPSDINGVALQDDDSAQDANGITPSCTS